MKPSTVTLVFPSNALALSTQMNESREAACAFADAVGLDEGVAPERIRTGTFGFRGVPNDPDVLRVAGKFGGRVSTYVETIAGRGFEQGTVDPKNTDGGKKKSVAPEAAMVTGLTYDELKKLEGQWIDVNAAVPAVQVEMDGLAPVGNREQVELRSGRYYVLGIREATDDAVITLGLVDKAKEIGVTRRGKYVYNIAYSEAAAMLPTKIGGKGGVMPSTTATGLMANAGYGKSLNRDNDRITRQNRAATPREEIKTERNAPRSRTRRGDPSSQRQSSLARSILEALDAKGVLGKFGLKEKVQPTENGTKAKTPKADKPLTERVDPQVSSMLEGLNAAIAERAQEIGSDGRGNIDAGVMADAAEVQSRLDAEGIDPSSLDADEIVAAMAEVRAEREPELDDEEEQPGEEVFENLEPGDVETAETLVAALSQRGVENPERVAEQLANGTPAPEWYAEAGVSLQTAKIIKDLYDAAKNGNG